jgi:hypothetical protein
MTKRKIEFLVIIFEESVTRKGTRRIGSFRPDFRPITRCKGRTIRIRDHFGAIGIETEVTHMGTGRRHFAGEPFDVIEGGRASEGSRRGAAEILNSDKKTVIDPSVTFEGNK